jgi:hypothetical protein
MTDLRQYKDLEIDWQMTPADAVALYLEWGNSGYRGGYENRVKSKDDYSNYFVVSSWDTPPTVTFVRRNSDGAQELWKTILPPGLAEEFLKNDGSVKGAYGVSPSIRSWLESLLYEEVVAA